MTDRLRASGKAVITENETSGRVAGEFDRVNNVHIVRSTDDLYDLFPDVTDGTWSSQSILSDGDMVFIDGRNAPYRHEQDLRIEVVSDVVIRGSAPIDLKPADGANAGMFVLTSNESAPSRITFRNVGFDGNQQNMTGGKTPFILNWACPNLHLEGCHAQHNYPYHVHNGGGTAVQVKALGTGFRAHNCTFDNVGDRSIEVINTDDAVITGCEATNGFDRMIFLDSVQHASVIGNTNEDTIEGSGYGVNASQRAAEDLVFMGNHSRGAMRNLFTFESVSGNPINRVFCIGNTKDPDTTAGGTAHYRNLVHQEGGGNGSSHHVYLGNSSTNDAEATFEIRYDHTSLDYNHTENTDTYMVELVNDGSNPEDCRIGYNNTYATFGTAPWYLAGGVRARVGGYSSTSNTSNTPSGALFNPGERSEHTNTGTATTRHIVRLPPHATGTWYEPATDTVF